MQTLKKTIILVAILLATHITANAQTELITGIGATYEVDTELYGINGRFYYALNKHFCFGPEVSFFPYQNIEDNKEKSIIDLNINGHYIFELTEKLGFYPLSGINYSIEKERLEIDTSLNEEEKEFGINYGFGAHYNISKNLFVFSEFKGIIGKLSDEFINLGLIMSLDR